MKKPKDKKFTVHYSFCHSDAIEAEAASESESEAELKVWKMLCTGEIGNLNEMEVGDSEVRFE